MRFGVQLFGISRIFNENPELCLRKLSEMGYSFIEPCIAFSELGGFEKLIWAKEDAARYSPLLEKYNLSMISCHIFGADLLSYAPAMKELSEAHGIKQFVMNCPQQVNREAYQGFADNCVEIADMLNAFGTELLLHNNHLEISTKIEGETAYEWLVHACGGRVGMQPDVGWVQFGGVDPAEFLSRNSGAVRSIHYKDIKGDYTETEAGKSGICLGKGRLDVKACHQAAVKLNIPQLVDQDMSDGDILADLGESVRLLKSL